MAKYLFPFLTAFLLTVLLMFVFMPLAKLIGWKERKSARHIHKKDIYRIGGVAMILVFNLVILLNKDLVLTPELWGMMVGTIVLMVVGVRDDIKEIYWKIQFFFQVVVSVLVFVLGVRIYYVTNPLSGGVINMEYGIGVLFSAALVVVWIVTVINATNWLDGIDGLSSGIAVITAITIAVLSLRKEVSQPAVAIIAAIFSGTVLGFLVFNFNPARAMAGTSGAMFLGFAIAVLAVFSGTKIATAILVMAIPIIDFFWVIGQRIRSGQPIFRPDRNHLHYRLLELGWPQKKIALVYYLITSAIAVIALNTRVIGKSLTLAIAFLVMFVASWAINKRISTIRINENNS
ncbi:MAG: hypothetical protein QG620_728 [Patescibacteria group bacterium]|nr:hypothetical protein [Patescibacteria group bacterium]